MCGASWPSAELDARDRELLEKGDLEKLPEEEDGDDRSQAFESAWLLAPLATREMLAVLRSDTRRVIAAPRFGRLCRTLAAVLLEHPDIGREDVIAILEHADNEYRDPGRRRRQRHRTQRRGNAKQEAEARP